MGKIKVSRKLFEALEDSKKNEELESLLKAKCSDYIFSSDLYSCVNLVSFMELAEIIVKGYEVEQTPQEKILEYYNHCVSESKLKLRDFDKGYWDGAKHAILNILEFKNEKIKGIND